MGYHAREMAALGADFHTRGKRLNEQIGLLRRLWTEEAVTFDGRWHHIQDGGGLLGPRPVQKPIPLWFGGGSEAAVQCAARLGDGWMPLLLGPGERARTAVASFRAQVAAAGREPADVALEVWASLRAKTEEEWSVHAAGWRELGATHYGVLTSGLGLESVQAEIDQLRRVREALATEFAVPVR